MKDWCIKILVVCIGICHLGFSSERGQFLVNQAQEALSRWDLRAAKTATQELQRISPKHDVTLYLAGVVAFYEGNYVAAKQWFASVGDLNAFEGKEDGFATIVRDLEKEGVTFQERKSEYVVVRYQNPKDEVMILTIEQEVKSILEGVGESLRFVPEEKILVEIYPSAKAFIAASPLSASEVKTSGTIALCKYGRILMTSPRSLLRGYPWLETLSHEYVHYVLTRKWGKNIPVWLHEGIAKTLESRWRQQESSALPPPTENLLAEALRRNQFVSFAQMHPSFAKLPSAKTAQLAYAQVFTFIDFLTREKGGWENLIRTLDQIGAGQDYEKAFAQIYGAELEVLSKEWRHWLKKRNLREIKGLDPITLQILDDEIPQGDDKDVLQEQERLELGQIASVSVRDKLHLGDLLRYRGRLEAALAEYHRASTQMPGVSPIVLTKLGLTYFQLGRFPEAKRELQSLVQVYPHETLAHQVLGDMEFREKHYEQAAFHYEKVNEVNPFNPGLYEQLVRVYRELKRKPDRERAQRALEILHRS